MLLGTFFNCILYGISITQTCVTNPSDSDRSLTPLPSSYLYWNSFSKKYVDERDIL